MQQLQAEYLKQSPIYKYMQLQINYNVESY